MSEAWKKNTDVLMEASGIPPAPNRFRASGIVPINDRLTLLPSVFHGCVCIQGPDGSYLTIDKEEAVLLGDRFNYIFHLGANCD